MRMTTVPLSSVQICRTLPCHAWHGGSQVGWRRDSEGRWPPITAITQPRGSQGRKRKRRKGSYRRRLLHRRHQRLRQRKVSSSEVGQLNKHCRDLGGERGRGRLKGAWTNRDRRPGQICAFALPPPPPLFSFLRAPVVTSRVSASQRARPEAWCSTTVRGKKDEMAGLIAHAKKVQGDNLHLRER